MRLPGPIRAAVGFVASATDEAKHLPDRAIELPMLAVSTALQLSLRAQQRYARLTVRGDEVLSRSQPSTDPPPWATFDDPVSIEELRRDVRNDTDGIGAESSRLLQDIFGVEDPAATTPDASTTPKAPAKKAPAKKATTKATPATGKKAPARKAAPATDEATPTSSNGKAVSKPRHIAPSAFDNVSDDE